MNRPSLKCLLIGVLVMVALSSMVPQADAFGHGGRGCGYGACYWPCYSPCYSCCSPCYSSCYGGYGSWGYSGWYSRGCCGSSAAVGWSTSESCCNGGSTTTTPGAPTPAPTPAKKPAVEPTMPMEPTPAAPAPAKTSGLSTEDSGVLTVWVPNDAKVMVNGQETQSKGSRRQFISYGLKSGLGYKYVVKAEVVRNGEVQEDSRTVVLTAGDATAVAFGFNMTQQVAAAQ